MTALPPLAPDLGDDPAHLRALIDAQRTVLSVREPRALMERVVGEAQRLTGADGACVELVEGSELVCRAASGSLAPRIGYRLPIQGSLSGLALTQRELQSSGDAARDPRVNSLAASEMGIGSMVLVPLLLQNNVVGVLKVVSHRAQAFDARAEATLRVMGELGGAALVRAQEADAHRALLERLSVSERQFATFMNNAPTAVFLKDEAGRYVSVNARFEEIFGRTAAQLVGLTDAELFPPEAAELVRASDEGVRRANAPLQMVEQLPDAEGRNRLWLVTKFPVPQGIGGLCVGGVALDITEREEVRAVARQREAQMQAFFQAAPFLMGVARLVEGDLELLAVNDALARIYGARPQELCGRRLREIGVEPAVVDRFAQAAAEALQSGSQVRFEYTTGEGEARQWMRAGLNALPEPGGSVLCFLVEDTTEQRRAKERLAAESALINSLFEASPFMMGVAEFLGDDIRFVSANPAFHQLFGLPTEQVIGRTTRELGTPAEVRQRALPFWNQALRTGQAVTWEYERGARLDQIIRMTIRIIRAEGSEMPRFAFVGEDVTARRREQLQRAQLAALVQSSDDAIVGTTDDGIITSWNTGAERLFGYAEAEVVGKPASILVPPERLSELETVTRRLGLGDSAIHFDTVRMTRSGQPVEVAITLSPVRNAQGELVGRSAIVRNISSAKAQDRQLRASLREKEVLLREVHHRVKNNLQLVISLLSLQAGQMNDPQVHEAFELSVARVRAIAAYHEQIYTAKDASRVELAEYVRRLGTALFSANGTEPERIALEVEAEDVTLSLESAIPCGLIVNELLTNALKHAFPGGRKGRVTVGLKRPAPGQLQLEVADDGIGLPPQISLEDGPTLGLQLVATLAAQLGGEVSVERRTGTRFQIRFADPVAARAA